MQVAMDPIVAQSLGSIDQSSHSDALLGWDWLANEAERAMGERPMPDDQRVAHWLGRVFQEGMSAFGYHAEVALAFFASVGQDEAVDGILQAALNDEDKMSARWVGRDASQLASDALRMAAHGCTDQRAISLLLSAVSLELETNQPGLDGQTPLHEACSAGKLSLVRALLACGADPNVVNDQGQSPLHCLAAINVWQDRMGQMHNRAAIIKELVSCGASMTMVDNNGCDVATVLSNAGWPAERLRRFSSSFVPPARAQPSTRPH